MSWRGVLADGDIWRLRSEDRGMYTLLTGFSRRLAKTVLSLQYSEVAIEVN